MNIEEQNKNLRRDHINLRKNIDELKKQLEDYRLFASLNKHVDGFPVRTDITVWRKNMTAYTDMSACENDCP